MTKHRKKKTGFKVPEAYFKRFEVELPDTHFPEMHGFKVPDGYFKSLSDKIDEVIGNSLPSDSGFKTPEDYFEHFEIKPPEEKLRVIGLFKKNMWAVASMAAAAVISVFILTGTFFDVQSGLQFENLTAHEIETWFLENPNSISTDELAEVLSDSDSFTYSLITDEELTDYLNNTDIESLIEN